MCYHIGNSPSARSESEKKMKGAVPAAELFQGRTHIGIYTYMYI